MFFTCILCVLYLVFKGLMSASDILNTFCFFFFILIDFYVSKSSDTMASLPIDKSTVIDSDSSNVEVGGSSANPNKGKRVKQMPVLVQSDPITRAQIFGSDDEEITREEEMRAQQQTPRETPIEQEQREESESSESEDEDSEFIPSDQDEEEKSNSEPVSDTDLTSLPAKRGRPRVAERGQVLISKKSTARNSLAVVPREPSKVVLTSAMTDEEIRERFTQFTLLVQTREQFCKLLSVIDREEYGLNTRNCEWGRILNRKNWKAVVFNANSNYVRLNKTFTDGLNRSKRWNVSKFDALLKHCNETVWREASTVNLCEFFDFLLLKMSLASGGPGPKQLNKLLIEYAGKGTETKLIIERYRKNFETSRKKSSQSDDFSDVYIDFDDQYSPTMEGAHVGNGRSISNAARVDVHEDSVQNRSRSRSRINQNGDLPAGNYCDALMRAAVHLPEETSLQSSVIPLETGDMTNLDAQFIRDLICDDLSSVSEELGDMQAATSVMGQSESMQAATSAMGRLVVVQNEGVSPAAFSPGRFPVEGGDGPSDGGNDGDIFESERDVRDGDAGEEEEAEADAGDEDEDESEVDGIETERADMSHGFGHELVQIMLRQLPDQLRIAMESLHVRMVQRQTHLEAKLKRLISKAKREEARLHKTRCDLKHYTEVKLNTGYEVQKKKQELTALELRVNALNLDTTSKQTELSQLEESVAQSKQELAEVKLNVRDFKATEEQTLNTIQRDLAPQLARLETIEGEITAARTKLDALTTRVAGKEEERVQANKHLENVRMDLIHEVEKLNKVKKEIVQLQGDHDQKMKQERAKHESAMREEKAKHDERLKAESVSLESEKTAVQSLKAEYEEKLESIRQERLVIALERQTLKTDQEKCVKDANALKELLNTNNRANEEAVAKLKSIEKFEKKQEELIQARIKQTEKGFTREAATLTAQRQELSAFYNYILETHHKISAQLREAHRGACEQVQSIIQTVKPTYPTIAPQLESIGIEEPLRMLSFAQFTELHKQARIENAQQQQAMEDIAASCRRIEGGDGAAGESGLHGDAGGDAGYITADGDGAHGAAGDELGNINADSLALQFLTPGHEPLIFDDL